MTQNRPDRVDGQTHGDDPTIAMDETTGGSSRTKSEQPVSDSAGQDHAVEIGQVGDYRLIDMIGYGGMGIVYRAEDLKLKRTVALKVIKPEVAANEMTRKRFLREAESAARIDHENVVTIYQVGEDNGVPFIAMRYLNGESLQQRLKREGRIESRLVANVGRQVATGLASAHELGLIHRDIKPDNIWIEAETGRIKILDFGLARTQQADMRLTQTGVILGTPKYMSPEQATGQSIDHRSDLFSLGSVLYRLLSGKEPFEGGDSAATLIKVTQAEFDPIENACPHLDRKLAQLVNKLLAKHPAKRPQTAREVAIALAEIEKQLEAEHEQNARRQSLTETAELVLPEEESLTPIDTGKSPRPSALALGLLALGVAFIGWLVFVLLFRV